MLYTLNILYTRREGTELDSYFVLKYLQEKQHDVMFTDQRLKMDRKLTEVEEGRSRRRTPEPAGRYGVIHHFFYLWNATPVSSNCNLFFQEDSGHTEENHSERPSVSDWESN